MGSLAWLMRVVLFATFIDFIRGRALVNRAAKAQLVVNLKPPLSVLHVGAADEKSALGSTTRCRMLHTSGTKGRAAVPRRAYPFGRSPLCSTIRPRVLPCSLVGQVGATPVFAVRCHEALRRLSWWSSAEDERAEAGEGIIAGN